MQKLLRPLLGFLITATLCLSMTTADHAATHNYGDKVYICDSEGAYAYHYDPNCRGLNNCKHNKIPVTISEAYQKGKKKLCGWED